MANYKISAGARADLERIWFYGCDNWGEIAADKYRDDFLTHFKMLSETPYLYPASELGEGYRRSICGRDNVYYRITDGTVEIMAVIGQQDIAGRFD